MTLLTQEESFHLVDNRPVKTTKFGGARRFQQNNRFQQQRRDGKDGRGGPEGDKKKGGAQQQKKQQFYGRDYQRVSSQLGAPALAPRTPV